MLLTITLTKVSKRGHILVVGQAQESRHTLAYNSKLI